MGCAPPGWRSLQICIEPRHPDSSVTKENIYVLEKSREVGQHCLSGALLDPRAMRELLPGFEKEAPLDAEVTKESVWFLTREGGAQISGGAAAVAGSRELRYLAKQVCEVDGAEGGGSRDHGVHGFCGGGGFVGRRAPM